MVILNKICITYRVCVTVYIWGTQFVGLTIVIEFNNERLIMRISKTVFSLLFICWVFILNGCGGGGGGGSMGSSGPNPTPSVTVPVITAFSINGSAGVIPGNRIAITVPYGTDITNLTATFTAPGSIVTVNGIPQISGVTTNNFTQPVTYTVTRISSSTSASIKASANDRVSYTVAVTVASISAKAITAFSLGIPSGTSAATGIISVFNIAVTVPFGTNITALAATFTTSGQSVAINGVTQVNGVTQNNFTSPVTYTVTAADGTTQNYVVTVTVASASSNDMIAFSLNGTPGVISAGGLSQTITVNLPNGTNVAGLVASFIITGSSAVINGVTQVSGTTQNDFANPVTYIVTSANGAIQTYVVTVIVSSASSNFINAYSFGNISGVISGQNIAVAVPFGTDVTTLIASFTTTGTNITIGGMTQTSTVTPNNFTNPVSYIVTSADGSIATYTVTVTVAPSDAKTITAFGFGATAGIITSQTITITMPFGTNLTNLIATFTTTGTSVAVNNVNQVSGATPNDFTNPVLYTVTAADGSTAIYTVTVTVATSSAKAITAFGFGTTAGVITGQTIAVTMPFGTDVTNLVATFTTTGTSVAVNNVNQVSGTTPNDFTNPVSYIVTAADGSTATYTVTVTVAASSAKAITAFSLFGVAGSINGLNITVIVPTGRSVTAAVATFTTTGTSVTVNGVTQFSGTSTNNFTNPVSYLVTAADSSTNTYTVTVNFSVNVWAWMGGSNVVNQAGVYGTKGVGSTSNIPGARDSSISWVDTSNTLWLFGGEGYDSTGSRGFLNDLWKYTPSTGQWTWVSGANVINQSSVYGTQGVGSTSNIPGARDFSISWIDASGNLWLFGGRLPGFTNINDLWKYTPSTNQWTWVSGSNVISQTGVYGTQGVGSTSNIPGARAFSISWIDASGNLWLFGGIGFDSTDPGVRLNDLWKYTPSNNQWTWVSGDNTGGSSGVYGTQGVGSINNKPGGRGQGRATWIDASGNLWLFGGVGFDSANPAAGRLNDLWKYTPSNNQWTWVSGANTRNQVGVYGTQGVGSTSNIPGGRSNPISWFDTFGNLWMFGGQGFAATSVVGALNDLWEYTPSNNQWTWVSGANVINQSGVYGTLGTGAASNVPGGRQGSISWIDTSGNYWMFGGVGLDSAGTTDLLNDLWQYNY
jgi:N-acetylneuraminic acid mutarotase